MLTGVGEARPRLYVPEPDLELPRLKTKASSTEGIFLPKVGLEAAEIDVPSQYTASGQEVGDFIESDTRRLSYAFGGQDLAVDSANFYLDLNPPVAEGLGLLGHG